MFFRVDKRNFKILSNGCPQMTVPISIPTSSGNAVTSICWTKKISLF